MVEDRELTQEEREDLIVADAFSNDKGLKALGILSKLFYERPSYNPNELQPYHTFYREGQRDVVGFVKETLVRAADIRAAKGPLTKTIKSVGA